MSNINPLHPVAGNPTTASVRNNFAAAKTEIDDLQYRVPTIGWNDLVQDVNVKVGTNAPELGTFRDNIAAFMFGPDQATECFSNFHMRHDYIPGTMIYPHVHWSINSLNTGVVRWGIEYTLARRWESTGLRTFGPVQTLYIDCNVAAPSQYMHFVNESPDGAGIPGTDLETDALVLCRFFRDSEHPNDTFPDPVFLLTVDIHYECSHLSTPSRFPPFY